MMAMNSVLLLAAASFYYELTSVMATTSPDNFFGEDPIQIVASLQSEFAQYYNASNWSQLQALYKSNAIFSVYSGSNKDTTNNTTSSTTSFDQKLASHLLQRDLRLKLVVGPANVPFLNGKSGNFNGEVIFGQSGQEVAKYDPRSNGTVIHVYGVGFQGMSNSLVSYWRLEKSGGDWKIAADICPFQPVGS